MAELTDFKNECPVSEPLIFDTHAHYDDKKFDGVRDELLSFFGKNAVCGIITCGCDVKSSQSALSLAERFDYIYAAVGYHPENLDGEIKLDEIEKLSGHKKAIAIGEIGLDYNWNSENRGLQMEIFEKQLIMANRLGLPVIVHDRDAHADSLELLQKHRPRGVVHCFSGSSEMAAEILKLGMYIGLGGVLTFKNSKKLPDVAASVPSDRFLLETDCPYLAPEPFRGSLCHSGMIGFTAAKLAEIRGCSTENILAQNFENTKKLFGI